MADGDTPFREHFLDLTEAKREAVIQPDGMGNDLRWETVLSIYTCATGGHSVIIARRTALQGSDNLTIPLIRLWLERVIDLDL